MPCIFCIAVFALLAGAVTTLVLDQMEQRLAAVTLAPPQRVVDSESVARFDAEVAEVALARPVPLDAIADAVEFLANARTITGQTIAVDSGQRLAWRTPDVLASMRT